jgi:hypothetical protein
MALLIRRNFEIILQNNGVEILLNIKFFIVQLHLAQLLNIKIINHKLI